MPRVKAPRRNPSRHEILPKEKVSPKGTQALEGSVDANSGHMQTQQLANGGAEKVVGKVVGIDSSKFPWNYEEKWPLTRAERLKELDDLSVHYSKTLQRANVDAAKLWHSRFPADQIVPSKQVSFQGGRIVEESEIRLENGVVWDEVSKGYYSL
jgi:hypothetical protein